MKIREQLIQRVVNLFKNKREYDKLVLFDLETTGLNVLSDRICQIGAVIINLTDGSYSEYNQLVNPLMHIPEDATAVHHITDEDVANAPTFKMIFGNLFEMFTNAYVAGFNSDNYDVILLSQEFSRLHMIWPVTCKCFDVLRIEKFLSPRNLISLHKKYTGEDFSVEAHDAMNDIRATVNVLGSQLEQFDESITIDDIIDKYRGGFQPLTLDGKIARNANDEIVFTFGKYNGVPCLLQTGYLKWMLDNEFSEDTKRVILDILTGKLK